MEEIPIHFHSTVLYGFAVEGADGSAPASFYDAL